MTYMEVLKEILEETRQNIFDASANYLMTIPRKGLEYEHAKYVERAERLEALQKIVFEWQREHDVDSI